MDDADSFGRRLDILLKSLNMSRGRLAQAAQVDKSLVGRWVSGHVHPSAFNIERITAAIAARVPGFTMLDWEQPIASFAERFGAHVGEAAASADTAGGEGIVFPFQTRRAAEAETAKRGEEYCGLYYNYRFSFGTPGKIARVAIMIRKRDGLLEVRKGVPGFEHRGWAFLMLNRLYAMLAEEKFESMAYLVTNAGQQPRARVLPAVLLSASSDGLLTPLAGPTLMVRQGDSTGDIEADDLAYEALRAKSGLLETDAVAPDILNYLSRAFGPQAWQAGGDIQITAPPFKGRVE